MRVKTETSEIKSYAFTAALELHYSIIIQKAHGSIHCISIYPPSSENLAVIHYSCFLTMHTLTLSQLLRRSEFFMLLRERTVSMHPQYYNSQELSKGNLILTTACTIVNELYTASMASHKVS